MVPEADISKFPLAGRQVVLPLQRVRTRFLSTTSNLPSKFGSSTPILSFLKDLVSTSFHHKTVKPRPQHFFSSTHSMSLCLSYTHPPSMTSFLVACRRLAVHTSLVFSSQQSLHGLQITLLVSSPHTLFSYFKTFCNTCQLLVPFIHGSDVIHKAFNFSAKQNGEANRSSRNLRIAPYLFTLHSLAVFSGAVSMLC